MNVARRKYAGIRALVIGLAREGTALARHLAEHGAAVTVTDMKAAGELGAALSALVGLAITYVLGEHPLQLLESADIVFVSPGVPADNPLLVAARQQGLPLSSETRLFTALCPAPIVGITGSSGKTTTTALTEQMLRAAGQRTWIGGNIGKPLLPQVGGIEPTDAVVMELSSFQLELLARAPTGGVRSAVSLVNSGLWTPSGWSPHIAAVLNVTPNHLDRHPSMAAYISAKAEILAHQAPGDIAIVGWDNPVTRTMGTEARGRRVLWFSLVERTQEGAFLSEDRLMLRLDGQETLICRRGDLALLGAHNAANVLAASLLAASAGAPVEAIRSAAFTFRGVEHRLELVRESGGVRWYNDSIATTPERTMAALQAFDVPIILLAGGRDKHLPWSELAALVWRKVRHLVLFGEAADLIEREMRRSPSAAGGGCRIHRCASLEQAVAQASRLTGTGEVVLLSPGGTSYDAYPDFAARGDHFRHLVRSLELP
ncbi:MAG TPA: UDP-N-acetylmuramoyl-L-alanine--D-glutamate ligase [Anaerolineae bacterium]|nr:UDP-N-acetylmuramoyl-L-alanine--D-glutamate ligase [Anaerolineae bacterium]